MRNIEKSLEYMTIATTLHDSNGNVIYANPIFCKLFNTNNSNIINRQLNDELINVDIISNFNLFEFINKNMNNVDNLIIKIKSNDEFKIIKINSLMIKNGSDFYILLYDDVTNNMSQSFLYKELFNNVKMGIVLLRTKDGVDFFVKDLNPFVEKNLKIKKDKLLDINIKELKCVNDNILNIIKNVYKTGQKIELDNVEININNNITWRNIYIYKASTGDLIYVYEDITDVVDIRNKITDFNKQKTTFLSNMSHELITPINNIVGFCDLLSDCNNKKQKEYINIIKSSTKMLRQLVDDILDMTKIESGKLDITKNSFDVNRIIDELILSNKQIIDSKIKIKSNKTFTSLKLFNDEFRFRQIFNNLISNSIKFTNNGEIEIGYTKNNNDVIFYVKDTGIGIKKEDYNKVFKRFEQLNNKNTKLGHGLGLSISKELVKLMGGDLWFESEYGVGTTFFFSLPNNRNNKNKINIDKKQDSKSIDLKGKTILIVEDIDFNVKLLVSYLEDTNVNIITAFDGNEALLKYNENKNIIDLILMDIQIPNMDGIEVTQIIRSIDEKTPIIAQTAYAMKEEVIDILEHGFNGIVKKPIRKEDLLRVISDNI